MGMGLDNVRRRLAVTFGNNWKLQLDVPEGAGVTTSIAFPVSALSAATGNSIERSAGYRPTQRRSIHPALVLVLVWGFMAFFWTQQSYVFLMMRGRLQSTYLEIFLRDGVTALVWACLTPFVVMTAARAARMSLLPSLVMNAVAAPVFILAHTFTIRAIDRIPPFEFDSLFATSIAWNSILYLLLVAFAYRKRVDEWLGNVQLEEAKLAGVLEAERFQMAVHSINPSLITNLLEYCERQALIDVSRCEKVIAEIGDVLRGTLEGWQQRQSTLQTELRRSAQYAKLLAIAGMAKAAVQEWELDESSLVGANRTANDAITAGSFRHLVDFWALGGVVTCSLPVTVAAGSTRLPRKLRIGIARGNASNKDVRELRTRLSCFPELSQDHSFESPIMVAFMDDVAADESETDISTEMVLS
jgi:hypothetical protein